MPLSGQTQNVLAVGDHNSPVDCMRAFVNEADSESDEIQVQETSFGHPDKASLVSKLSEKERNVAALKRVLALM